MNGAIVGMNLFPRMRIAGSLMSVEALKSIGFLLMLGDHANRYLLSGQVPALEALGRLVFPIFALVLGLGLQRSDWRRICRELLVLGVLAQLCTLPLVAMDARPFFGLNVAFTLAAGALLVGGVALFEQGRVARGLTLAVGACVLSWFCEYGPIGAVAVLAAWRGSWALIGFALAALSAFQLTAVPLFTPLLFVVAEWSMGGREWRAPKQLFGRAYAYHFVGLAVVRWLIRA